MSFRALWLCRRLLFPVLARRPGRLTDIVTPLVASSCYRYKMPRVHTGLHSAEMVKFQSFGDGATPPRLPTFDMSLAVPPTYVAFGKSAEKPAGCRDEHRSLARHIILQGPLACAIRPANWRGNTRIVAMAKSVALPRNLKTAAASAENPVHGCGPFYRLEFA